MDKKETDIIVLNLEEALSIMKREQRNISKKTVDDISLYENRILGLLVQKEELGNSNISSSVFIRQIQKIARCGNTRAYEIVDVLIKQNKIGKTRIGRIVCYYMIPEEERNIKKEDNWYD